MHRIPLMSDVSECLRVFFMMDNFSLMMHKSLSLFLELCCRHLEPSLRKQSMNLTRG